MATLPNQAVEDRIFAGLVKVAELVNDGTRPNDAIVKVAREDGLPARDVRLMVNAYNTARTNRQRSQASDVFGKSAEFELADAAAILGEIYPARVKTAAEAALASVVSDDYETPPSDWACRRPTAKLATAVELTYDEPAAPTYERDPDRFLKRAAGALVKLTNEREALHHKLAAAEDEVASAFGELCTYFRHPGCQTLEDVATNATAFYGPGAAALLTKVAEASGCCMASKPVMPLKLKKPKEEKKKPAMPLTIKRSSVLPPMDRSAPPYRDVEQALAAAAKHKTVFDEWTTFEKAAVEAEFALGRATTGSKGESLAADETLSLMKRLGGEKRAFGPLSGPLGAGLSFAAGNSLGGSIMNKLSPKSDDKVKQDAYSDLTDPSHESQLRAVRTQATLHGLMNSPYFEGEDPRQVTELFNNLTKMSPRMADQPLLLESAMKRLMSQGSADPHDLDQLLGIELKQKQRDQLPGDVALSAPGLTPAKPEPRKE